MRIFVQYLESLSNSYLEFRLANSSEERNWLISCPCYMTKIPIISVPLTSDTFFLVKVLDYYISYLFHKISHGFIF